MTMNRLAELLRQGAREYHITDDTLYDAVLKVFFSLVKARQIDSIETTRHERKYLDNLIEQARQVRDDIANAPDYGRKL